MSNNSDFGHLGISMLMLSLEFMAFSMADANPLNDTTPGRQKSNHPMSFAWSLQPLIGIYGTLLNSFVLYMGYVERQTFIRPVNAMIWYEYIVLYSKCLIYNFTLN